MAIYFGKPNTEAVGEDITGDKVNLDLEPNPVIFDIDAYAINVTIVPMIKTNFEPADLEKVKRVFGTLDTIIENRLMECLI